MRALSAGTGGRAMVAKAGPRGGPAQAPRMSGRPSAIAFMSMLPRGIARAPRSDQAQHALERAAEHLAQKDVHFLNPRRDGRRHDDEGIGEAAQIAALATAERRRAHAHSARRLEPEDDVAAPPRGADTDGEIAGSAQRAHLPGEEMLEAQIVADRGERRAVRG